MPAALEVESGILELAALIVTWSVKYNIAEKHDPLACGVPRDKEDS
jgi:hypothetical protein